MYYEVAVTLITKSDTCENFRICLVKVESKILFKKVQQAECRDVSKCLVYHDQVG